MGLESPRQTVAPIDVSSLVRPAEAVVEPRAVNQLVNAMREGVIGADDVLKRVGKVGRARDKAELQSLTEKTSPEAVEARSLERKASIAQNKGIVQTSDLATKARETELQSAIWRAQAAPGNYDLKLDALTKAGVAIPVNLATGLTDEDKAKIDQEFTDLSDYTTQQVLADQWAKNTKAVEVSRTGPLGEQIKGQMIIGPDRQTVPEDKFKAAFQFRSTPYPLWKAQGKNKFNTLFGVPGAAPTSSAPAVEPKFSPVSQQARIDLINRGANSGAAMSMSDDQAVQARVPVTKPVVEPPQLGQVSDGLLVTDIAAAKKDIKAVPAEGVSKLIVAQQANEVIRRLDQSYKSLIESDPVFTGLIAGTITKAAAGKRWNEKVAGFEREVTALLAPVAKGIYNETGVLSDKDVARYMDVLPDLRDNPKIGQQKINTLIHEGRFSYQNSLDTWKRAGYDVSGFEDKMSGDPTASTPPSSVTPAAAAPVTLSTGRKVVKGADGKFYEVR